PFRQLQERLSSGKADERAVGVAWNCDREPDRHGDRDEDLDVSFEQIPFAEPQPESEDRRDAAHQHVDQRDQPGPGATRQLGRAPNDLKYAFHSPWPFPQPYSSTPIGACAPKATRTPAV